MKKELGSNFTPATDFAIAALKYQSYFHFKKFSKGVRRVRASSNPARSPLMFKSEKVTKSSRFSLPAIILTADSREERAARKIQAMFKGFYVMQLKKAHKPGLQLYSFESAV